MGVLPGSSRRKSGRDLRHARETRTRFWRVSVVAGFFVVVLGANLFIGAALMLKALHRQAGETAASLRFGRVIYPILDGVFCRNVFFDNNAEQAKKDRISLCDDRDLGSAGRASTTFNWRKQ
jgi:phosphoglycerol transferase MdoB-like AlkP superfamily enzyme